MEHSRPRTGELVAAASGALLPLSLFLPWYGTEIVVADVRLSTDVSGWEALTAIDAVLFVAAVVAIAVAAARAADALPAGLPTPSVLVAAGVLSLLLVLFRILDLPIDAQETVAAADRIEVGRRIGVYVALVASAGILYGGWRGQGET